MSFKRVNLISGSHRSSDGVGINCAYNPQNTPEIQHWPLQSPNGRPSAISKEASPSSSSSVRSSNSLIDENKKINGSCIVLTKISSIIDEKTIFGLLSDLGFLKQPSVYFFRLSFSCIQLIHLSGASKITVTEDNGVFLDFFRLQVAHAAYSILRHRAECLWNTNSLAETRSSRRASGVNIESSCAEMFDLTGVEDNLDEDHPGETFA